MWMLAWVSGCQLPEDRGGTAVGNPNLEEPTQEADDGAADGEEDFDESESATLVLSFEDPGGDPVEPDTVVVTLGDAVLDEGVACEAASCDVDLLINGWQEGVVTVEIDAFVGASEAHDSVDVDYDAIDVSEGAYVQEHTVVFTGL